MLRRLYRRACIAWVKAIPVNPVVRESTFLKLPKKRGYDVAEENRAEGVWV